MESQSLSHAPPCLVSKLRMDRKSINIVCVVKFAWDQNKRYEIQFKPLYTVTPAPPIQGVLYRFLQHEFRLRSRLHQCDERDSEETLVDMSGFGISPESVPTELGGSLDFNYHQWSYDRWSTSSKKSFNHKFLL